jgi:hypothetical protein
MKSVIGKITTAIFLFGSCQGLLANGYPQFWVDCNPVEPFMGKAQEVYLGDDALWGGFLMEVNTDDGGVGLFGNVHGLLILHT